MKLKTGIRGTLLFLLSALSVLPSFADSFEAGERLEYGLSWGILSAGKSVMAVVEVVQLQGAEAYHLLSETSSNDAIASVYTLNDRIDTYVAIDDLRTLKYVAMTKENERVRDEIALFDYSKGEIDYKKRGKGKKIVIPANLYDSISSFYYLRRLPLKPGKRILINTFSGGKIFRNRIQVIGREKVTVKGGTFNTLKIFLIAVENDSGKKKGESYLWLSDDERKIPVKIKTKSSFGYIVSELEKAIFPHEK